MEVRDVHEAAASDHAEGTRAGRWFDDGFWGRRAADGRGRAGGDEIGPRPAVAL